MVGGVVVIASIMGFLLPSGSPNSTQNIFNFADFCFIFRVYLLLDISNLIMSPCVSIMIIILIKHLFIFQKL